MVDTVRPGEIWSQASLDIWKNEMAITNKEALERQVIEDILSRMLPEVCRVNVYRMEAQRSYQAIDQGEYIYGVWTFYNDERVRLKARILEDEFSYMGIKLEPQCDDFEEWQANAIMRSEAGTDVWDRPKQQDLFATPAGASMSADQQQQGLQSRLNQLQGNISGRSVFDDLTAYGNTHVKWNK